MKAKTGPYPKEIKLGQLTPLQKPGEKAGPPSNLRPIILLSLRSKILAIIMIKRISGKILTWIPVTQAAYQTGRSTTEHLFAVKLITEMAITHLHYTVHLLMLDMSKAFDTVNRKTLFVILSEILDQDELHILKLLTDVKLPSKNWRRTGRGNYYWHRSATGWLHVPTPFHPISRTCFEAWTVTWRPRTEKEHHHWTHPTSGRKNASH